MQKKSHELQWLEVMSQRKGLTEEEIKVCQRLKRGYEGEIQFTDLCELFLKGSFESLEDLTLSYQNTTVQIDKLVLIEKTLYVIDVKYYRGHYRFENNEWHVGRTVLSNNIYEQLRRAVRVVQNIFQEAGTAVEIQGVLAFINPESTIAIVDSVSEETLSFEQIPGWLMKIRGEDVKVPQWKNLLQSFEIERYRTKRVCGDEKFKALQKGIRCPRCGGFDIEEGWHKVTCSCGFVETRETAYVRTICEYGVIMHHQDLVRKNLTRFFGPGHDQFLKRVLAKHFELKLSSGPYASYENKGILFEYWFEDKKTYFEAIESRKNWKRVKRARS